jgi:hypothetical protein
MTTTVLVNLLGSDRTIHRDVSMLPTARSILAALSDSPDNLDEMTNSLDRFLPPYDTTVRWSDWKSGLCLKSSSHPLLIIDLTARLILWPKQLGTFPRRDRVTPFDPNDPETIWFSYLVPQEWLVTDCLQDWRQLSETRRAERAANPPLDTRSVLFGNLAEFLVDEVFAARGMSLSENQSWTPPRNWRWRELPERAAAGQTPDEQDAMAEIHARWLMTPRADLGGRSPRDVLQADMAEISMHLHDRQQQWLSFGECPPLLRRESSTYRWGGYGVHQRVVYYHLIRELLNICWNWIVEPPRGKPVPTRAEAIDRLRAAQQDWLHTPNPELLPGLSPVQIIDAERSRRPLGAKDTSERVDCECPLCRLTLGNSVTFIQLDGCEMDDEFPFTLWVETRRQWEARKLEFAAAFPNASPMQFDEDELDDDFPFAAVSGISMISTSVWKSSFVRMAPNSPPDILLFGVGAHLAEMIEILRNPSEEREWIEQLNLDFDRLVAATRSPGRPRVIPAVSCFNQHLRALGETRDDLVLQCRDLEQQLIEVARQLTRH